MGEKRGLKVKTLISVVPLTKKKRLLSFLLYIFSLFLLFPPLFLGNSYYLRIYAFSFINAIIALGLNMAVGVAGQINLGQAALAGTSAYSFAILLQKGIECPLAVVVSFAFVSLLGLMFGYVSNRLTGPYLAIVTLAFNLVFTIILNNETTLTGGPFGLKSNLVLSLRSACMVSAGIFLLLYFVAVKIYDSHLGRCFRAVRDDEVAAGAYGVNPVSTKVLACLFSSFLAGIGGILQVCSFGYIAPTSFTTTQSFRYLAMIVVGGLGYLPGTIVGAAVITLVPEFLRWFTGLWDIILGTTIIILLLFFPEGFGYVGRYLSGLFGRVKAEERWTGTIKEEMVEKLGGGDV